MGAMATLELSVKSEEKENIQDIVTLLNDLPADALVTVRQFVAFLHQQAQQGRVLQGVEPLPVNGKSEKPRYQYPTVSVPASKLLELAGIFSGYEGDALADTEALYDV